MMQITQKNIQTGHPSKFESIISPFLKEATTGDKTFLYFRAKIKEEDFEKALSNIFDTALAIKKRAPSQSVTLSLDRYLICKWDVILKELGKRSKELTHISSLDFQMSDFTRIMLYELCVFYQKHLQKQDLPYVLIQSSIAHFESKSIIKQPKSEGEPGIAFLKKLVFSGNDLAEISFKYW